jgi:hypothetical protein
MATTEPEMTVDGDYKVFSFEGSSWRLKGEINNSLARAIAMFLSKEDKPVTADQVRDLDD